MRKSTKCLQKTSTENLRSNPPTTPMTPKTHCNLPRIEKTQNNPPTTAKRRRRKAPAKRVTRKRTIPLQRKAKRMTKRCLPKRVTKRRRTRPRTTETNCLTIFLPMKEKTRMMRIGYTLRMKERLRTQKTATPTTGTMHCSPPTKVILTIHLKARLKIR